MNTWGKEFGFHKEPGEGEGKTLSQNEFETTFASLVSTADSLIHQSYVPTHHYNPILDGSQFNGFSR